MRLLLIIIFTLTLTAQQGFANTATPGALLGQSTGSGGCDLAEYKKALGHSESGGKYGTVNTLGYIGKYQFGEGLSRDLGIYSDSSIACSTCYQDFSGQFNMSECGGVTTKAQWLACPAAQEKAFEMQYAHNYKLTKKCHNHIGQPAPKGGCSVSLGGIMGGAHLGGAGGVCKYLNTNGGYNPCDDYGTCISDYVCKFSEVPVPHDTGECSKPGTPGDFNDTGQPSPAGGAGAYPVTVSGDSIRFFNDLSDTLKRVWVATFQLMTEQLVTNMMHQAKIIGTFFDAKHQLETQRLLQKKYAEAHKDYHPSEQMCTIGTAVRDLANSEKRAELTKTGLTNTLLDRALATGDVKTIGTGSDQETRREEFKAKFCNKKDNTEDNEELCGGDVKPEQSNADINFTQTIDKLLTIDLDMLDGETKPEEENIFALLDYIFMHESFPWLSDSQSIQSDFVKPYQDMRSVVAIRSVAQNSFAEIIAQKTQGPENTDEIDPAAPFIKALMKEMGVEETDIEKELGERPSYYAQMEVLTKKIYQHPEFVSNLYDKPANVKRIIAAMTAIKVMQDRDIHKALMRREMLMSMLLEIQLRYEQQDLENREIRDVLSGAASNRGSGGGSGGGGGGGF